MANKLAALMGLVGGCALLLYWGGEAPNWLLKFEVLAVSGAALAYGYTAYSPSAPAWLRDDAVRGVALVYMGMGAMFVPLNFLASAFLIGTGTRMVMKSASWGGVRVVAGQAIGKGKGEVVLRESGPIVTRH